MTTAIYASCDGDEELSGCFGLLRVGEIRSSECNVFVQLQIRLYDPSSAAPAVSLDSSCFACSQHGYRYRETAKTDVH